MAALAPAVALFDFDGVLFRGDSLVSFIWRRIAARPWCLAVLLVSLPVLAWVAMSNPRRAWSHIIRIGLLGLDDAGYVAAVAGFARRAASRTMPGGLGMLQLHRIRGDRVIIVTGCEERLVRALLHEMGLDDIEVLASTIEPCRLGQHLAWHNTGTHKLVSLHRAGLTAWRTAYGNSAADLPMLGAAQEPVLVNARHRLFLRLVEAAPLGARRMTWR